MFDLIQEATPVVDEDLLEVVTLAAKSCGAIAKLSISKEIDFASYCWRCYDIA